MISPLPCTAIVGRSASQVTVEVAPFNVEDYGAIIVALMVLALLTWAGPGGQAR